MESDADLVRRCLAGDRVAWADLLARYGDLVYGLLRREGLDAATSADAFQEVSILLWKRMGSLRHVDRLLPWIATTTRRVAWRTRQRAHARAGRLAAVARPEADPAGSPADALAGLEREQAVRQALSVLGERCRQLLTALYFQPFDDGYDGLAERLGIPRGSLGPTRKRCLQGLRKELLGLGFTEEYVSPAPRAASSSTRGGRRSSRRQPR